MGHDNTAVQTPAREHCIRASTLQAVLGARHFKNSASAGWHAVTGQLDTGDCSAGNRFCRLERERRGLEPLQLRSGINALSDIAILHLVERTLTAHGPAEVKRTWGVGYRDMRAQLTARLRGIA